MRIASISNEVRCHEWGTGILQSIYKPRTVSSSAIHTASWGKDGGWMVLVPSDSDVEIVCLGDNVKLLHTIQNILDPSCAAFQSLTKRNIAVGTANGQLMTYDIKSKVTKKKFARAPGSLFKVNFTNKDSHVVSGCETGEVFIHNHTTAQLTGSFRVTNSRTLTNFKCHPYKRNLICASSEEGIVTVWDMNISKTISFLDVHNAPVTDLSFCNQEESWLVTAGMDRRVCFVDYRTNNIEQDVNLGKTPSAIDVCPEGSGFVVGFTDGKLVSYDYRYLKEVMTNFSGHKGQINQILFERALDERGSLLTIPDDLLIDNISNNLSMDMNSPSQMYLLPDIPEVDSNSSTQVSLQDSFMDAMGLNSVSINGSISSMVNDSMSISDGVKKLMDSKPNLLGNMDVHEVSYCNSNSQHFTKSASTPITAQEPSPIYPSTPLGNIQKSQTLQLSSHNDIKAVIRDELEEFKNDVKYQIMEMMASTRRHFMDLQMSIVKEFIKVEDNLSKVAGDMHVSGDQSLHNHILKENIRLSMEVASLKEQLKMMMHK